MKKPRKYLVKNALFGTAKTFNRKIDAMEYKKQLNETDWGENVNAGKAHLYKFIE